MDHEWMRYAACRERSPAQFFPSDGVVYTAVTDAPWSDLAGAVRDLPHASPPGRLRQVAQTVVSLFRWR